MRIDAQITAHLRQQVVADFFLPILEGSELLAEVQATRLPLPLSATKRQTTFLRRANFCTFRSNSAPFTRSFSDRSVRQSSGMELNCGSDHDIHPRDSGRSAAFRSGKRVLPHRATRRARASCHIFFDFVRVANDTGVEGMQARFLSLILEIHCPPASSFSDDAQVD